MLCLKCNKQLPETDALFCTYCGEKVPEKQTALQEELCGGCGSKWPENGGAFCPKCGGKKAVAAQASFCTHCGGAITSDAVFCTHCGKGVGQSNLSGQSTKVIEAEENDTWLESGENIAFDAVAWFEDDSGVNEDVSLLAVTDRRLAFLDEEGNEVVSVYFGDISRVRTKVSANIKPFEIILANSLSCTITPLGSPMLGLANKELRDHIVGYIKKMKPGLQNGFINFDSRNNKIKKHKIWRS